ncbi:MAG: guanylate kinase [Gammaproteobacteria bacterium]|jgi:guanylate kinase|nr:guanylate kinase [Gammaproteobacteria bacterium]|tara:strand:- start:2138 stop:2749 length:612 start_codon:yes stop_codon:yes gene_type:complete
MDQAKLIIFSAPSGAGKSSLIRKLIELGEKSIELSVSATTRLPREGEVHGKDYFFISDDEFNQMRENDAFLESAIVHGFQYATLRSFVEEKINSGISIILDIDVQGFIQIKNSSIKHTSIFILPPSFDELEKRLHTRGLDSKEVISKRLENALTELKSAELFDYIVLNDEFSKTIEILSSILFEDNFEYNKNTENILRELLDK